ncbi:hypothetical protein GCM10017044_18400 [Kordiimonas sediminis]|uniref:Co-chaperone DjlA N-terminal domain-containing protein n=1 Tax=Kordiimonas sediminis TaxID=1735581 RepID=A0A919E6I9_9PROT|nr:TerB family tellurite resistance protein [Kordiimonas sediminis]GHF24102.1 hypothetical protein GCM10017044_18400 [Kordiimonas sediminis]
MSLSVVEDATLKTLAVMTHADTNIRQVEVEKVQEIMKEELGVEVTSAEVRVAARYEFIEDRAIGKFLKSVVKKLSDDDKRLIMRSLIKVVKADDRTAEGEGQMFNEVAAALGLTPADIISL